jgi:D-glycero-alpha-D-manno-heptose-7-phosphate kinase
VGLLNALHAFRGERVSAGQLAEEASYIEIDVLKQPIGKQDQYAAAFGGLNSFCFKPGGGVTVEPQRLANGAFGDLFNHIMMFWTGHQRDSSSVLAEQKSNTAKKMESLLQMREHAGQLQGLTRNGHFDVTKFGRVLDEGWHLKRQLATTITTSQIDAWYRAAMAAGAEGGKLCGAGGGGFLLFLVKPERRLAVRQALEGLTEVSVEYEAHGSYVLLSTV